MMELSMELCGNFAKRGKENGGDNFILQFHFRPFAKWAIAQALPGLRDRFPQCFLVENIILMSTFLETGFPLFSTNTIILAIAWTAQPQWTPLAILFKSGMRTRSMILCTMAIVMFNCALANCFREFAITITFSVRIKRMACVLSTTQWPMATRQ